MEDFTKILAVSWMTQYCRKTVHYAVSLAVKYDAELYVIHVIDNWFDNWFQDMNLPMISVEEERKKEMEKVKNELDGIVYDEAKKGLKLGKVIIKKGDPVEEILRLIEEEKIDVAMMRAHEEGRIERLLIGSSNNAIIRKMPCSIFLVKQGSQYEDYLHRHHREE